MSIITIADFIQYAFSELTQYDLFYGHGTDNAWDETFTLVLDSLNIPHDANPEAFQAKLTESEKNLLLERLEKRIVKRIPVPYLTNKAYFCDLQFYVDDRVLIPRSPIAELIKNNFAPWINPDKVHSILDLCTGSGSIAIACCYAFPEANVDASDISKDSLEVAAINRERHNLQSQLNLIQSDCFTNIPPKKYDIIVSNPPYIGFEEMQTLPAEYYHEPNLALEAEEDGLIIVKKILKEARNYLTENGILVVEVGNSDLKLQETFPDLPFIWLEFEDGGHGVFLLNKNYKI